MSTDTRFSDFLSQINKEAEQTRRKIESESEACQRAEMDKASKQADAEVRTFCERRRAAIFSEAGREQEELRRNLRRQLYEKREELSRDLFDRARERIADFVNSDAYEPYLRQALAVAGRQMELAGAVISVRREDVSLVRSFGENRVQEDDGILLGGMRIASADGRRIVDATLDAGLEKQREEFRDRCGLSIG